MCGITGIVGNVTGLRGHVERAARLQDHRGPDFFRTVVSEKYCFCHNRLSVIDLSPRSHQPVETGQGILVFNGEIYNFKSLSARLPDDPEPVSDTLALHSLLSLRGASVLPELDGMFAFAWYDKTARTLLLARDRTGIKPLYYAIHGHRLFFSSEIKTITAMLESCGGYSRTGDLDPEYIAAIIAFGHTEFQRTPFTTIRELPPGTHMIIDAESLHTTSTSYFCIPDTIRNSANRYIRPKSETVCIGELDRLINESVKLHLISDAPLGILCSGGVDSSLITALAAKSGADASIYHAAVEGSPGELPYAEMVAERYDLHLHTITMNDTTWRDHLVDATYHLDAPVYHPSDISLYAISQKAHSHGIKALLCGEGADELFGGYGWHSLFSRTWKAFPLLKKTSRLIDTLYRALKLYRFTGYFEREELFYATGAYLPYSNNNLPLFGKRNALLRSGGSGVLLQSLLDAYSSRDSFPHLAAFITSNLFGHLATLLQRNDRMCMKASIESRVPFLENSLIDFALRLDSSYKVRGRTGKYIVKKCAERYLPRPVIYRKKAGFPVPWQEYTRRISLRLFENGFISGYFNLPHCEIIRWATADVELLFTAVALEIWGRITIIGESRDRVRELVRG